MSHPKVDEGLTPEAQRRKALVYLGLDEEILDQLRALDPEETLWRIDLDRKVALRYVEQRYAFMVQDTITDRPKEKPKRKRSTPPIVMEETPRLSGTRLA